MTIQLCKDETNKIVFDKILSLVFYYTTCTSQEPPVIRLLGGVRTEINGEMMDIIKVITKDDRAVRVVGCNIECYNLDSLKIVLSVEPLDTEAGQIFSSLMSEFGEQIFRFTEYAGTIVLVVQNANHLIKEKFLKENYINI